MTNQTLQNPLRLSRHPAYRIFLGVIALPILAIAVSGFLGFDKLLAKHNGVVAVVLTVLVGEFFLALAILSVLSIVWAVAAPRWVQTMLSRHALIVETGIYLFFPGMAAFFYCFLPL
ncbi:MAG: hypothetical protein IID44_18510 [Planctomycetes bacterium]|nr:hypothetical protein [Planctomycetota bacterium]